MRAKRIGEHGFSLAEVMVGMLLAAIMVTAVFTVALTVKRGVSRSDNRSAANNAARLLLEELKNYQTADQTAGLGPNAGAWSFPVGACAGEPIPPAWAVGYCAAASYALSEGCAHCATLRVPAALRSPPIRMTMLYRVTNEDTSGWGQPGYMPRVETQVDWVEPPS